MWIKIKKCESVLTQLQYAVLGKLSTFIRLKNFYLTIRQWYIKLFFSIRDVRMTLKILTLAQKFRTDITNISEIAI